MELRIRDLSKTYPNGVEALKGVTLTIPKGMFGLLGANGAGKSTLMRTIATLQEPDGGSIYLAYLAKHRVTSGEQTITVTVDRPPARAGIDPYNKLIDRTVRDNVEDAERAR